MPPAYIVISSSSRHEVDRSRAVRGRAAGSKQGKAFKERESFANSDRIPAAMASGVGDLPRIIAEEGHVGWRVPTLQCGRLP